MKIYEGNLISEGQKHGIIVGRFNEFIGGKLLSYVFISVFHVDIVFSLLFLVLKFSLFFFQAEDGIRDKATLLEFRRVLFRSCCVFLRSLPAVPLR